MWQQRLSADSDFCRALVGQGYMTGEQVREAVERYRLGRSRQGGVIFWQIDMLEQVMDGKIMYYGPDCHRDHGRHPQWVSNLLKRQLLAHCPDLEAWMPASQHCLFGTHLLREETDGLGAEGGAARRTACVVEAEKTAVILSARYRQQLWLAAGGLTELTAQKLFPLRHHRIVLFPDTDPDMTAYRQWYGVAKEARRQYGLDISVSSLLERKATAQQKAAKIDLVDFLYAERK